MNTNKKIRSNACYELRKKYTQLFGNSEIASIICDINSEESSHDCLAVPF